MNSTFLQERIDACKARIVAYETAISALISGTVQSYTLDTGQSKQTVTKFNLNDITDRLDKDLNLLTVLEARLNGSGSRTAWPSW